MSTIRGDGPTISAGVGSSGTGGTVHAGGDDISSGFRLSGPGTVHTSGPDIGSNYGPSSNSIGLPINTNDPLVINSITYLYQGVISKSTGEAEIYLLSRCGKKCVFKLYYPNFKPKEDVVKQLKQINHGDIINVLDYGYYHDRFFEIMDFAEGGTLDKYLPIKDVARIKQVVAEIINAFKFCHAHGIIHKDIKPQNIYCKNVDGSDILIGDFGISSILETGMSRHLTSQSLTVGYAAPEMYGVGGKAYVGQEVDYYALGISIIHIWDGKNPFDDLNIHAISNLTTSGKVHIPGDMPREMQNLVKGLITVDYTKRWGYDEIQRCLKGDDVPIHFQIKEINYPPYQFGGNETAATAEELAGILKGSFDKGKKHLYSGKLSAWVNLFNQGLAVDLDRITEDDYPTAQVAGLQKAIYILNPDEPFARGGKEYRSAAELATALEEGFPQYTTELADTNHSFYLYLEAHDAEKEAGTFRKYFTTFSAKKALNTIILELRGRESLLLGGELFFSPEELLKYKDKQFLVYQLQDPESLVSLWIEGSSFKEIKSQLDKWRTLDKKDQEALTVQYALGQGGPFGVQTVKTHDRAGIYYELARQYVKDQPFRVLNALKMCLFSQGGKAYFYKIAIDDIFGFMENQRIFLLYNFFNNSLSREQAFIDALRLRNSEHQLVKIVEKENALFEDKKIQLEKEYEEKKKEQKRQAQIEINGIKLNEINNLKKRYNQRYISMVIASILVIISTLIIFVLLDKEKISTISILSFNLGLLFGYNFEDYSVEEDESLKLFWANCGYGFLFAAIGSLITWFASAFEDNRISLLTSLLFPLLVMWAILNIVLYLKRRVKSINKQLLQRDYKEQLKMREAQIDSQLSTKQEQACTASQNEIIKMTDDELAGAF